MGGLQFVLAGAAIGNGNRGVEALGRSVADGVHRELHGARLSILDDGWGVRPETSGHHPGTSIELVGVRRSWRWHRPESWAQVRAAQATFPHLNEVARRFRDADAVLDISGGDSFTDLYGPVRFRTVRAPKEAALRAGKPLVLLPQTYGPFTTPEARRMAEQIVRSATLAFARDPWSFEQLLELAGPDADPSRLHRGVDVAFALQPHRPPAEVADLVEPVPGRPTAGVNISGSLQGRRDHERYGLAGDYLDTMTALVEALVESGARVCLVPHVHLPNGAADSDIGAIEAVIERLDLATRSQVTVLPPHLDATEVKWCIAQFDWFVGSRMHSTIAALSTMTPSAAYAYSDKTRGVFETCGVSDQCIDARTSSGPQAVEMLMAGYRARAQTKATLSEHVPATVTRSRDQLRDVFALTPTPSPALLPAKRGPRQ